MRISDWSSDVCSSDLGDENSHHDHDARLNAVIVSPSVPERQEEVSRSLAGAEGGRRTVAQLQDRFGIAVRKVGWHQRRRRGRSEEHTSELQSLMRLSSAVFFLNKKTDTNSSLTSEAALW